MYALTGVGVSVSMSPRWLARATPWLASAANERPAVVFVGCGGIGVVVVAVVGVGVACCC